MPPVGAIGNSEIINSNFSSANQSQNNNQELIELCELNEKTWLRIGNN